MGIIQAFVPGIPQPQGSKAAFLRGKKVVMIESNRNLPAWRKLVTEKLEAANVSCIPLEGAVALDVMFFVPRPKSVTRQFPSVKPDLDKYIRSIGDSATDAGCLNDDGQIVEIVAYKCYADAEQPAGALVTLSEFIGVSLDN